MISYDSSELEYPYGYPSHEYSSYPPTEFSRPTYGVYEGPPPLQNVQYYKKIQLNDYSRDEVASLVSRVGKTYQEHKNDKINPFTKEKIYSGVLALEGSVIGGYILTSLNVALPSLVFTPACILGVTALIASYSFGKVFLNCLKKTNYYNPQERSEVFQRIKMGNLKSLERDLNITDIIEFDLASEVWSNTATPEDKVQFYLNLKKFIDESRSILANYQKNIEALEEDDATVHSVFHSFEEALQNQEFQTPLIKAKWDEWYGEQRNLYRTAYTDAIGALETDFRVYIEPFLVKNI